MLWTSVTPKNTRIAGTNTLLFISTNQNNKHNPTHKNKTQQVKQNKTKEGKQKKTNPRNKEGLGSSEVNNKKQNKKETKETKKRKGPHLTLNLWGGY